MLAMTTECPWHDHGMTTALPGPHHGTVRAGTCHARAPMMPHTALGNPQDPTLHTVVMLLTHRPTSPPGQVTTQPQC